MVPVELLTFRSHPNDSRGNVCFPAVFRSRAVKSRENIDFPNPVHTKTVHKKGIPLCSASRDHQTGTARSYSYICRRGGGMSSDPSRVLRCITYWYPVICTGILVFFFWRIRIVLILSCFRRGGRCVCGGCIAGFLPKRSRMLDAPVASSKVACCQHLGSGTM